MKPKELFFIILFFSVISAIFFYKSVLFRQIPFPGDLLADTPPYKTQSYLGYNPGSYPNKAQDIDVLHEMYPWRYFSVMQLKNHQLPFWNPHNFSGNPQFQNYQTGIFYPLNILYFVLPFTIAWTLIIISQPLLAGLFMYLFLRSLTLRKEASGIGAIAFGFSSYMTVWMEYGNIGSTLLWLPLILFFLRRFIEKKETKTLLFLIAILVVCFLAGYIQGVFYIYIVSIAYFIFLLFRTPRTEKKLFVIPGLVIFILPVLLTAFQLIPTIELFLHSTRNPYSLSQITDLLQPIYYFVTIFVPDFFGHPATRNFWLPITYIERVMYVGIPILFFALYSFIFVRSNEKIFWMCLGGIFLLVSSNIPGISYLYMLPIPVLSTTVPTRALSIFIFCMIVCSAFGIDYWLKEKHQKLLYPLIFLAIYVCIWLSVLIVPKFYPELAANLTITRHTLFLPTGLAVGTVLIFLLRRQLPRIVVFVLYGLVLIDLFYFFIKITPFSPAALIYPVTPVVSYLQSHAGINRFWGLGDASIPPDFQEVDGTYSTDGDDALHLKDYGTFLESTKNGDISGELPRMVAGVAPGYGGDEFAINHFRQTALNLLGVKYILTVNTPLANDAFHLAWKNGPWQVYENKKALPRYFLASQYIVAKTSNETIKKLYETSDLSKTLILQSQPSDIIISTAAGKAVLQTYMPNEIVFRTSANGNMLLFLSDTYYPSWKAKVDGNQTHLYKADGAFRAAEVPSGIHTVEMYYSDFTFMLGIVIGVVALIIGGIYLILVQLLKNPFL